MNFSRENKTFYLLFGLFSIEWIILAIDPVHPEDWLLENVLVIIAVPLLLYGRRSLPFSNTSYSMIFLFLGLHEIGSHYTYAEVPYDQWVEWVEVCERDGVLEVATDIPCRMTIWSPEASEVRVNGKRAAFVRSGGYAIVEAPCTLQ